jgi:hypothetical protein
MLVWGVCILFVALLSSVRAAAPGDALVPGTATAQAGSATWIVARSPFTGDANLSSYTTYEYSTSSDGPWIAACDPGVPGESDWRQCLLGGLTPNTDYWVRVTFADLDDVNGANPQIVGPVKTSATSVTAASIGAVSVAVRETYLLVATPLNDDSNLNSSLTVDVATSAGGPWVEKCGPTNRPVLCRIPGLISNTAYWVRVTASDPDGVSGANPQVLGPVQYTGMTNLALGKPITADPGWACCTDPAQLVDGRIHQAGWPYGYAWTGGLAGWGGGSPGWKQATIDLGSTQTIARVDWWTHDAYHVPKDWQIQVSSNGITYTEVFTTTSPQCRTETQVLNTAWYVPNCGQIARFAPVQARYVRYRFDDRTLLNNGIHGWAVEIEVFGPANAQWVLLTPAGQAPTPRTFYSTYSAYDTANDRMILFSGAENLPPPFSTESWVLTNASGVGGTPAWVQLNPTGGPPTGRESATSVYDPVSNRLIVHGGCSANCSPALTDTWVLSNANGIGGPPAWSQLPSAPIVRDGHVAAYDSSNNRMIVFGGQTGFHFTERNDVWVLKDANGIGTPAWEQLSTAGTPPAPRVYASGIYDPFSNTLTIFGGMTSSADETAVNDVWVLSHANGLGGTPTWTQISPIGVAPPVRRSQSAVYDPSSNRMIVFGGFDGTRNIFFDDVWVLTGANGAVGTPRWIQLSTTGGPPPRRFGHAAGYAVASNRLVALMGSSDYPVYVTLLNDVWTLTNANGLATATSTYTITGQVRDAANAPIEGVTISDGAGHTASTDSAGNYRLGNLPASTYSLSASKSGYTFAPNKRDIFVPPNATGQNFVGTPIPPPRYTIAGQVRDINDAPIGGVTVSCGGHSATTNSSGAYTITNLLAGACTLTPTKSGYSFTPPSRPVTLPPDATVQDFSATNTSRRAWTFMLYLAGDNDLDVDMERAIRSMEARPANANVNLVVMIDDQGSGNTRRLLLQPGGVYTTNVNRWNLGERNMGDPQTLAEFITWSRDHYPADRYYLAVADHGRGTSGVAEDDTSGDDLLTPGDLWAALNTGTNSGAWKIDVLHFDTCLMAMLEDAYQIKDFASYMIASENLGWSVFAYERYAQTIGVPAVTPRQLAVNIADIYFNHPWVQGRPRTISVMDLSKVEQVTAAVDRLSAELRANLVQFKNQMRNVRNVTQKFDSRDYYRITIDDEYLDLYDLAARLKQYVPSGTVQARAQEVMDAVTGGFVIAEHHQSSIWSGTIGEEYWDLNRSHGVSIYFPPLPSSPDYNRYVAHQIFRFTTASTWDEFLIDYFGALGLPPDSSGDPELPPMLPPQIPIYVPIVIRE